MKEIITKIAAARAAQAWTAFLNRAGIAADMNTFKNFRADLVSHAESANVGDSVITQVLGNPVDLRKMHFPRRPNVSISYWWATEKELLKLRDMRQQALDAILNNSKNQGI